MFGRLHEAEATKNLLIINVIIYLAVLFLSGRIGFDFYEQFAVFYFDSPFFKPWQIVTHMFMHGGMGHIFFNMFSLYMFGAVLERVWGAKRFLIFYLICGLGALLVHQAVDAIMLFNQFGDIMPGINRAVATYSTPTVGASGAIYGLLVAFAYLFPNTEIYLYFAIPIKAKYLVIGLIILGVFMGASRFQGDNIAHFAHLGGALTGFILMLTSQRNRNQFY